MNDTTVYRMSTTALRLAGANHPGYRAHMEPQTSTSDADDTSTAAAIEALIGSDASPVGIDAKKTHVIIIQKLMDIQARLERLERIVCSDQTT